MSLSAFLRQNKKESAVIKYAASKNFVDDEGMPVEWELKQVTCKRESSIKSACSIRNKNEAYLDTEKYTLMLSAATVVNPNLNDRELQDSYGVMGAENLLQEMLSPGELLRLWLKTQDVNDFNETTDELVEEAKN